MTDETMLNRLVGIFRAMGDPVRLRFVGLIAERPRTGTELAEAVAVGAPTVSHHMDRLVRSGVILVERRGQSRVYSLNEALLKEFSQLVRGGSGTTAAASPDAADAERAKVVRDFFDGERLKQIPAQRKKRVIVLQHLVERFDPNREYPEREVNELLRRAHEDVATLRRELVDYGYMTRAGGVYRVARELPTRSVHLAQEITHDEQAWLRRLLSTSASA